MVEGWVGDTYFPFTRASMMSSSRVSGPSSGRGFSSWVFEEDIDSDSSSEVDVLIAEDSQGYGGRGGSSETATFDLAEESVCSKRVTEGILPQLQ